MSKQWMVVVVCGMTQVLFGCGKEEPKETKPQEVVVVEEQPKTETTGGSAEEIFAQRCVTCHGADGKGDGPGAKALAVKPRNYTDAKWQTSVTDEHIREIIVKGGAAVGKDPGMPPNPDLADEPEVVEGLVKKVRSFGK